MILLTIIGTQLEKSMRKSILSILVTMVLASGCATTSSVSTKSNVSVADMKLDIVNVSLKQKYDNPIFYSQSEIEKYLNACLISELNKKGKYNANSNASLTVNVDYKRVYSGEAFGMKSSVGSPKLAYTYQVANGSKILQQNNERELFVNAGLLGNFNYTGNTTKQDENMHIDALCRHIAEKIY